MGRDLTAFTKAALWAGVFGFAATTLFGARAAAQEAAACRSTDPSLIPASSKPYFMLVVDTSGSMNGCTNPANPEYQFAANGSCPSGATPNSCGLEPTRLNDAKCAMRQTVQAFAGEVNFGLETYAMNISGCGAGACQDSCTAPDGSCTLPVAPGDTGTGEFYQSSGCSLGLFTDATDATFDSCGNLPDCAGTTAPIFNNNWRNGGNVVVDLRQDRVWDAANQPPSNAAELLQWFDGQCDDSREIFAAGATPLEGSLRTAHQYLAGSWSSAWANGNYCATGGPLIDHVTPIDATFDRPCRSLNVILVTDGAETCGGNAAGAAAALYNTGVTIQGQQIPVRTFVIGFAGVNPNDVNPIADNGDDGLPNGSTVALAANNEVELAQRLAAIISGSVSPEVCDNVDNNCNGCTDELYQVYCNKSRTETPLATLQGLSSTDPTLPTLCCANANDTERDACIAAYEATIVAGNEDGDSWLLPCWDGASGTPEASWLCVNPGEFCDEADNNCDADFVSPAGTSVIDENQNKCGSPLACPSAETCDGADQDCDGVVDNAPGNPNPGSLGCTVCNAPETCNGCDDDGDTVADGLSRNCALNSSPFPECFGSQTCPAIPVAQCDCDLGGNSYGACDVSVAHGGAVSSDDTTCNGFDDDCDGQRDEDYVPAACPPVGGRQYGAPSVCTLGTLPCVNGSVGSCQGAIGPSTEICDDLDNDCDGLVDSNDPDLQGVGGECGSGEGECTKGTLVCTGGTRVCGGAYVGPSPEVCDGLDNDCDGLTDEGQLGDSPVQTGESPNCWVNGGTTCQYPPLPGAAEDTWDPPAGTDATCTTAGTLTSPCAIGQLACQGGAWSCVGAKSPVTEVCDLVDNDCDGSTDEGLAGGSCGTSQGECTSGTLDCQNGVPTCIGGTQPATEVCDDLDNDCDGQTDEDVLGVGDVCGVNTGACQTGVNICDPPNGVVCGGSFIGPTPEICNGIDDDCNGVIDDALTDAPAPNGCWDVNQNTTAGACQFTFDPGTGSQTIYWDFPAGASCSGLGTAPGLTAPCSAGTIVCVGAAGYQCQGGSTPNTDVCDGVDNDCDGVTDDVAGLGTPCGSGTDQGTCQRGQTACTGGLTQCVGEIGPSTEVCDGADNDCDGFIDGTAPTASPLSCTTSADCVGNGIYTVCLEDQANLGNFFCVAHADGFGDSCGSDIGACAAGVRTCVAGAVQCVGQIAPAPSEICNNIDDDCDGATDEQVTDGPSDPGCWSYDDPSVTNTCSFASLSWDAPPGATCTGVGALGTPCALGTIVCVAGGWGCVGSRTPGVDDTCDGVDDDCDGNTDDEYADAGNACSSSVGACQPGQLACVSGTEVCQGGTSPQAETCNNVDDNCDGFIDGTAPLVNPVSCNSANGNADCAGQGIYSLCLEDQTSLGNYFCVQPPTGFGQVCGTDTGLCQQGIRTCVNGNSQCVGEILPQPEVCNGQDDDCDGAIDDSPTDAPANPGCWNYDDVSAADQCTFSTLSWDPPPGGTCSGLGTLTTPCRTGTLVCGQSGWLCQGGLLPAASEQCDLVDNDCDGTTDEGNPGGGASCGQTAVGACQLGTETCTRGQVRCIGEIGPKPELCDNVDNDCDGTTDEGAPGAGKSCGFDTGACTRGLTECQSGVLVCAGADQPQPEVCDGLDNDCNGLVDDGALQDAPQNDACWNNPPTATAQCSYEEAAWDAPPGANCQDLGSLSSPCDLGFLACDGLSGWTCRGGQLPSLEVCDGLDNNCDGTPDDGNPGGGAVCGTNEGECVQGSEVCTAGAIVCQGAVDPSPEVCDGLDNDCDGTTDDGITLGEPCDMTYDRVRYPGVRGLGECRPGVTACDPAGSGAFICIDGVAPSAEVCDGVDNDCDGQVDEAGPAPDGINGTSAPLPNDATTIVQIGSSCGIDTGVCAFGQYGCVGGQVACVGGVTAQLEVCDCLDNDCDGEVDELATDGEVALCGTGTVCVNNGGVCQCSDTCGRGEFDCPSDAPCQTLPLSGSATGETDGVCWRDPCGDCATETVTRSNGTTECGPSGTLDADGIAVPVCTCRGAEGCHGPCFRIACDQNFACVPSGPYQGNCFRQNNCNFFGCADGEACVETACVASPCEANNTCAADEVCKPNADFDATRCVGTCAGVACGDGEACHDGACEPTGCSVTCPTGEVCLPGGGDGGAVCGVSPCPVVTGVPACNDGSYCEPTTGACITDPCEGVVCPAADQACYQGECIFASDVPSTGGTGGTGGMAGAPGTGATGNTGNAGGTGGAAGSGGAAGEGGSAGEGGAAGGAGGARPRGPTDQVIGLATGGGGCRCGVPSRRTNDTAWLLAALAMGAVAFRRRAREEGGAR